MAANSVNEIYFMNAYIDLLTTNNLLCPCGKQDGVFVDMPCFLQQGVIPYD